MALYGLIPFVFENDLFSNFVKPLASIEIALPIIGGQQKLEELISIHAPKGAKIISVGQIKDINIVLESSKILIGYNPNSTDITQTDFYSKYTPNKNSQLKVIPIDYYGYN